MKDKDLGFKFWAAVAISAIGMGVVIAFVAGFFLGHFTGHKSATTVAANTKVTTTEEGTRIVTEEEAAEKEAAEEEAAEAKAAEEKATEEETAEKAAEEEAAEKAAEEEAAEKKAAGGGEEASGGEAALAVGKGIVESTCSACHTLSEAGATGTVGPNLDELKPSKGLVEHQVTNGGGGMPAFGSTFSTSEIEAVAEYVSQVAGTGNDSLGS